MRGELLLYTPVVVRSNRIPPPCVFATQDSTRKDSTQTFNIKSHDDELAHIRAREVQTHFAMQNESNTTVDAAANAASVESSDAAEAQTFTEGQEKKFSVKVLRVHLFEQEDIVNVSLTFDKSFPGFVKNKDGEFIAADINVVSLSRSSLTKQLCEIDETIAMLRDGQKTPLSRAQISTLIHGASVTISRVYHKAGYVRENGEVISRDQWFTTIQSAKLTEFSKQLVQQVVIQRMMNDNQ